MSWLLLTFAARPWEGSGEPFALVTAGERAGEYAVLPAPDAERFGPGGTRFLDSLTTLLPTLAARREDVLSLRDLLVAIPDRGTAVRFSPVRTSSRAYEMELERLRREAFGPRNEDQS